MAASVPAVAHNTKCVVLDFDQTIATYAVSTVTRERRCHLGVICELLQTLKNKGVKLYVVTEGVQSQLERYLRTLSFKDGTIRDLFDGIVSAVKETKSSRHLEISKVDMLNKIMAEVGTTQSNMFFIVDCDDQCWQAIDAGYLFTFAVTSSDLSRTITVLVNIVYDKLRTIGFDETVRVKTGTTRLCECELFSLYNERYIPLKMHLWLQDKETPRTLYAKKVGKDYVIGNLCYFKYPYPRYGYTQKFRMHETWTRSKVVVYGGKEHVYVMDNDVEVELFDFCPLYPPEGSYVTFKKSVEGHVCVRLDGKLITIRHPSYADSIFCVFAESLFD
ncbi:hypothetical protein EBU95_17985 [bacterium]|uniref:Uncharacterized protein n=1 Tax=viral metagenome TaxID=1070528 RepID=A0A6C0EDC5_9ZZZZ|nr:hypothetical protein [bacterium]